MRHTPHTTAYTLEHIVTSCRGAGVLRVRPPGSPARTVIVLHGLSSSKEHTLRTLYLLAQAGFDTVCIDLFLHGERPEAHQREQRLDSDFLGSMRAIIYESATDVVTIASELGIDFRRSGVLGISTGGFVAHVLAIQAPQMQAYAAAITSPDWLTIDLEITASAPPAIRTLLQTISPLGHSGKYPPLALLQMNGLADDMVLPSGALALHERLLPLYAQAEIPERLQLITYPELAHQFTDTMLERSIEWFDRFLPAGA